MKKIAFATLAFLMTCSIWADNLTGKYNFNAPSAPIGFQSGTIEFKNVENKTIASVDFGHMTYELDVKQVDENHYFSQMPMMGDEIKVSLDNTNGEMKTIVNAMGEDINVELTKKRE